MYLFSPEECRNLLLASASAGKRLWFRWDNYVVQLEECGSFRPGHDLSAPLGETRTPETLSQAPGASSQGVSFFSTRWPATLSLGCGASSEKKARSKVRPCPLLRKEHLLGEGPPGPGAPRDLRRTGRRAAQALGLHFHGPRVPVCGHEQGALRHLPGDPHVDDKIALWPNSTSWTSFSIPR